MNINELLGIDPNDPLQMLANRQLREDEALLDALVAARAEKMSVEEVASAMCVDPEDVLLLERRERDPRLSTIRLYALAIGAEVRHDVERNAMRLRPTLPDSDVWNSVNTRQLSRAEVSAVRAL